MKLYNVERAVNELFSMMFENRQSLKFILSEEKTEEEAMFDSVMEVYKENPMKMMTIRHAAGQKGIYEPERIRKIGSMLEYASRVGFLGKERIVHLANGKIEPQELWCFVYSKELMGCMEKEIKDYAKNGIHNNKKERIRSYLELEKIMSHRSNERYIKKAIMKKHEVLGEDLSPEQLITASKLFFKNGIGGYYDLKETFPEWEKRLNKSGVKKK